MKQVYLIAALLLGLVLVVGSPAFAGVIPGENTDDPGSSLVDGGGGDEDHPWGGDRVIGGGEDFTTGKYVRVSAITGIVTIDLFISGMTSLFVSHAAVTSRSVALEQKAVVSYQNRYSTSQRRTSATEFRKEVRR